MQELRKPGIGAQAKSVASFFSDVKTIIGVVIGVVAAIFFAGVYYRDAIEQINTYQNKIEQNGIDLQDLRSQIQKLQNVTGDISVKGTDGSVAGSKGSVSGLAGTYSLDNDQFVQCPPGSFVSAIQGFKPNGQAPIVQIRYACRSLK
jgi:hypothetical protein